MDVHERRTLLVTTPNPSPKLDYVTGFEGHIDVSASESSTEIVLRYVPDRHILEASSFEKYLQVIEQTKWRSLEEIAVTLLDDIRNELVARWVQVNVKSNPVDLPHLHGHSLTLEDYQPNWQNEDLLSHLPVV